jgi:hypothetical protein
MSGKKDEGFWDLIGKGDPKTAVEGLWDMATDLTPWSADTSKDPKPGIKPPNPTARRTKATAPKLTSANAAKTVALNLVDPRQWFRTFKDTVTAIPSLLTGEAGDGVARAYVGQQMAERRANKLPVTVDWYRNNILLPRERRNFTDDQIRQNMQTATRTWNVLSNEFSYVDPKTKQRVMDWNAVSHRLVERPADIVLMFTGLGEVGAAGRLASLARLGRIGEGADIISNAGNIARKVQTASRIGSIAADPLTALAVTGGTKALVRGASIANRTISNPVTSILDPDYVTAFEAYKDKTLENLVLDEGLSPKEANQWIKQNKDNMFYSFNAENGGRFSNPYNPETTAMFVAQGKDPSAYGAPSIYNRVNQTFNRTGGPNEAALRQVSFQAAQVPNPRRSATTLEPAPASVAQGSRDWAASQQANLAKQLDERMSANYPGQQLDYDAIIKPTEVRSTDPVAGSTLGREKSDMGQFVYGQDGAWYSTSGQRAGPALQPILNEQYRLQTPNPVSDTGPNISPADLDFVRRNRAASSDLGQASAATPIPPEKSALGQILSFGQRAVNPLTTGISTFALTQSPTIAGVTAAATGVKDIYRGAKAAKDYIGEVSGAPFNYNPSNPLLRNNALIPRTTAQVASAVVPNPTQLPPAEQQQRPATAAPVPAVVENREAIKMPELKPENSTPAPMQPKELAPQIYDLSEYGIAPQKELKTEKYDLSQYDLPQRMYGGRAAYKAGGKVGSIEPLIQALMNKAKTAKKVSNKATEPLLNQHDNAIANALAVAQKAI